ncbi:MAG: RNA-binding protein [Xanthobacteraceae bacterium]
MADKLRKRPRDFSQAAKLVIDVATGQVEDREPTPEERGKDPAAAALGRKGGAARAAKISPTRRAEIARTAAAKRWKKD